MDTKPGSNYNSSNDPSDHDSADLLAPTVELCESASRYLYLLSPSASFRIFDSQRLAEAMAQLARRSRHTELRILIDDPGPQRLRNHWLLNLARRIPSKVRLHCIAEHPQWQGETLVLRDHDGLLYKPAESLNRVFYEANSRALTKRYLELFETLWRHSEQPTELRQLSL